MQTLTNIIIHKSHSTVIIDPHAHPNQSPYAFSIYHPFRILG